MKFLNITAPSDFATEDIRTIEIMIQLGMKKEYLAPRPSNWVREMIQSQQIIALKDLKGKILACAMISEVFQSGENKVGLIHGAVWRGKYEAGTLLRQSVITIARQRFGITFGCIRKTNHSSIELWTSDSSLKMLTHPEKICSKILAKIHYDPDFDFLLYTEGKPKLSLTSLQKTERFR